MIPKITLPAGRWLMFCRHGLDVVAGGIMFYGSLLCRHHRRQPFGRSGSHARKLKMPKEFVRYQIVLLISALAHQASEKPQVEPQPKCPLRGGLQGTNQFLNLSTDKSPLF